ncbi:MAG: 4-hydroxybutyrate CoA-transferase [Myxococcales bacterium]|nr:4-hydroxybutyrate CoA-transferase [Myxococcales bacterium]
MSSHAWHGRRRTAEEATAVLASGDRVFIQGAAATPNELVHALTARAPALRGVEIVHLHTEGDAPYASPELARSFRTNCLFIGANLRQAVNEGHADYTPIFLSEVPGLFRSGRMPLDVALVHVSPPDRHGMCSLGVSVDCALAATQSAKHVIALVNPQMPRTHGDGMIPVSALDSIVEVDRPVIQHAPPVLTDKERAIGENVADLIEDGSTLQMGIGSIPDAVLGQLKHHRDLGVHTEMFSDGLVPLVECGAVNNRLKHVHRDKVVSGFVMGSKVVYDFVDDNPRVAMLDIGYINDTNVIRTNPKVVAINSAIEVDITGQVVSDSIGHRFFSGIGGQMDFMRGAALSEGGKAIIALPSRTSKGRPRIVGTLQPNAGVVTTRGHVQYVVTEWGVAELYGRNIRKRAEAMISLAHPDDRAGLTEQATELGWL